MSSTPQSRTAALEQALAATVDGFTKVDPLLTYEETLFALETLRHTITEFLLVKRGFIRVFNRGPQK